MVAILVVAAIKKYKDMAVDKEGIEGTGGGGGGNTGTQTPTPDTGGGNTQPSTGETEEEQQQVEITPPAFGQIAAMSFAARGGKRYTAEFYKREEEEAVVRELTPAVDPFETQENDSDDRMEPMRGSTGYLRFVYDGGVNAEGLPWWLDMMPADATELKVLLKDAEGAVMWQGFVKPSQYSQDYGESRRVIELPIVSVLEVLTAVEMPDTYVMKTTNMRETIVDAIKTIGAGISFVMVPFEWGSKFMTSEINAPHPDFNWQAPLKAKASRFVWFDVTGAKNEEDPNWREYEGKTYGEVLSDFVRYWGWTMREQGDTMWLVSRRAKTYMKVDWETLQTVTMTIDRSNPNNYTQSQEITLTDDKLDGTGHTLEAKPAYRTVKVSADTHEVEKDVLAIGDNDVRYVRSVIDKNIYRYAADRIDYELWYSKALEFEIKGGNARTFNEPENEKTAEWVKIDLYYWGEQSGKKNYSYTDAVRADLNVGSGVGPLQVQDARILEIKSRKSLELNNGYLVIDLNVIDYNNTTYVYRFDGKLKLKLKAGGYYWNGQTWTTEETAFTYSLKSVGSKGWEYETVDQKTLDMNCNGAKGCIIPINRNISGDVSLTWILSSDVNQNGLLLIKDFAVKYYPEDGEEEKDLESVNRYYANTGATGTETKEIELNLATLNNNNPGYGILKMDDMIADGETFMTIDHIGERPHKERPEEVLLNTASEIYGRRQMKLTMVTTLNERERPIDSITRAEWEGTFEPAAEHINWVENRRTVTLLG